MDYDDLYQAMLGTTATEAIPRWVLATLTGIARGERDLRAIRHPLGFICLPVQRRDDSGVCVHLWTRALPTAEPTTSTIHCHSWDLTSYVLYGQVRNGVVRVRDDGAAPTHRVYAVRSRGETDELEATGRLVRCLPDRTQVVHANQVYALPAGRFHTTVIAGGEAATVALGQGRSGAGDLSLGPPGTPTHVVRRKVCDAAESALAARLVIRRLAANCTA